MANNSGRLISAQCPTCRREHFYITDTYGKPASYAREGIDMTEYDIAKMIRPCGNCARLVDPADPEYINRLLASRQAGKPPTANRPADTSRRPANPDKPSPNPRRP